MIRPCDYCGTDYEAQIRYLNRGQGQFCSQPCSSKNAARNRPKPDSNAVCAYCGESFYKSESKMKSSKSGLFFCCREHKDMAQRIGGIEEIMPDHYGKADILDYRVLAKRHYPYKCKRCGWDEVPGVLEVNHIDCNRKNNSIENLEILCPTCHAIYHFVTKTGKWKVNKTPNDAE